MWYAQAPVMWEYHATDSGRSVEDFLRDMRKKETQPRVEAKARRKGWSFHERKAYTCQLCGMPKTNQYGHASRNGKRFCSIANSGKSPEQWLSEQRATADD